MDNFTSIDLTNSNGKSKQAPVNEDHYDYNKYTRPSLMDRLSFYTSAQFVIAQQIIGQLIFVIIYTIGIILVNDYWLIHLFHDRNSIIPILGLVCGLLLVFRTNTAYDRYYEGRRLWSSMMLNIRTLTRWIWILVMENSAQDLVEKKSAVNLLLAYAVSVKHYLREEYSYEYEDLKPLIGHLPKMFAEPCKEEVLVKRRVHLDHHRGKNYSPPTNIPLQLSYDIGIYVNCVRLREKWDTAMSGNLLNALNGLVSCLSGFDRIKRTPIPLAYSVHLHHVIWIYILSLPIELVEKNGWYTVPVVAVCAFTFIGILAIGSDIEDPFDGSTQSDLPLDDLCEVLRTELNDIMSTSMPTLEELYMNSNYFPLDGVKMNSKELSGKLIHVVRELLRKNRANKCSEDDGHDVKKGTSEFIEANKAEEGTNDESNATTTEE